MSDVDCLDLFAGCGGVSLGLHLLGIVGEMLGLDWRAALDDVRGGR